MKDCKINLSNEQELQLQSDELKINASAERKIKREKERLTEREITKAANALS